MAEGILNVTNGDGFNEYFLRQFGGEAVPFREVMMDGETVSEIGSREFVAVRCRCLGVDETEYHAQMRWLARLKEETVSHLCLWFGRDTFCQMNLLTLLAYLEQIGFDGQVELQRMDDESFALVGERERVTLGCYEDLYREILMEKRMPVTVGCLEKRALELYFDYGDSHGKLARLVRDRSQWDETALICFLLEETAEYGLSDLQAKELIRRYRTE